jgi:FPC/CPF motif-containing protein YcgG
MTIERSIRGAFNAFVADSRYPCLAAKGLERRDAYHLGVYGPLGSAAASRALGTDLAVCGAAAPPGRRSPTAFVVALGPSPQGERESEPALGAASAAARPRRSSGQWDPSVSDDPAIPAFFSFAGTALFVIGLHPGSSGSRAVSRARWCSTRT